MTRATLAVIRSGPGNTIQDGGRHGWLRVGVTTAGPMDWMAHALCNALAGNVAGGPAIEITIGGIEVELGGGPLTLAVAAPGFAVQIDGKSVPSHGRFTIASGTRLAIRPGAHGMWAYLTAAARFDLPEVMGSVSTHTRSGIGGIHGRPIQSGDTIDLVDGRVLDEAAGAGMPQPAGDAPIRVVLGPQADYFSGDGLHTFLAEPFRLTAQMDRMAYRLEGPRIVHTKGFNIISDGIAMGAIQVPGDGQPLVLMADRQPTGGYPKIATIIRADIGRLAQMRAGALVHFAAIDVPEATAELRRSMAAIEVAAGSIAPLPSATPDAERLLASNLIDGVVSATADPWDAVAS